MYTYIYIYIFIFSYIYCWQLRWGRKRKQPVHRLLWIWRQEEEGREGVWSLHLHQPISSSLLGKTPEVCQSSGVFGAPRNLAWRLWQSLPFWPIGQWLARSRTEFCRELIYQHHVSSFSSSKFGDVHRVAFCRTGITFGAELSSIYSCQGKDKPEADAAEVFPQSCNSEAHSEEEGASSRWTKAKQWWQISRQQECSWKEELLVHMGQRANLQGIWCSKSRRSDKSPQTYEEQEHAWLVSVLYGRNKMGKTTQIATMEPSLCDSAQAGEKVQGTTKQLETDSGAKVKALPLA